MFHTPIAEGSFFRRADPATKARFDDVVSLSVHLLINLRLTTAMSRYNLTNLQRLCHPTPARFHLYLR